MAGYRFTRCGWGAIASLVVGATLSLTAPTYAKSDQTETAGSHYGDLVRILVVTASDELFFNPLADLKVLKDERRADFVEGSGLCARSNPMKERASRSAIRPSAVAGWRSGRVRHLAT